MSKGSRPPAKKASPAREPQSAADAAVVSGPIKKNPVESVITTLPIIMLLGGLAFYYFNERRQVDGQILIDQIEQIDGAFSGISAQSEKPEAQRILWIKTPSRLRGGRVSYKQAQQLDVLTDGDPITVWAAPKVQGSKTLWVVKLSSDGKVLIEQEVDSANADTQTNTRVTTSANKPATLMQQ